ncbi:unnamed protein product [Nippostrongylus brasiliensis]|uniref:Vacuolar protein sorting-associated protein VTA1 homolog (inferred by orthology to a human protein) n=1 Tax=Nippostrongylus brasiliensis TaxID=27835 RepID=A0A0N4Y7D6_NIPBR|nr:unnamed protein product [Nippostrongylus brasiliensis]
MSAKVPATLKPIAHYIKIANENSSRDPVVYYWCLFYAVQQAMQLDKSSPEALLFLTSLLGTLETIKKQLAGTEAITNEVVAQAHLEDFALKLFKFADAKEKTGQVDKSVVHAFYTAGHVMDVLSLFGEIDEPFLSSKKYAKWKSTQIFSCLKEGRPYVPSSQNEEGAGSNTYGGNPPPVPPSNYAGAFTGGSQPTQPNYGFSGLPNVPGGAGSSYSSTAPQMPQANYNNPTPMNTIVPEMSGLNIDGQERKPTMEAFQEARKFTKYALSAIDYEDTRAVVENLRKALALMEHF